VLYVGANPKCGTRNPKETRRGKAETEEPEPRARAGGALLSYLQFRISYFELRVSFVLRISSFGLAVPALHPGTGIADKPRVFYDIGHGIEVRSER